MPAEQGDDYIAEPLYTGVFSLEARKYVSITEQPELGVVMLAFSDESDPLGLNSQSYHVPTNLFRRTVEKWLATQPKD